MLDLIRCSEPDAKRERFLNFNPSQEAWIVSDLQSKWHLQSQLLDRNGVLEQASLWRATELWRHFAFQLRPDLKVLSPELAQVLFWSWVEPLNLPWARSPRAIPVLMKQMQMWMSVFAAPNYQEIMAEWFQANQESYVRWGHWFELCAEIWQRCQVENLTLVSWLPALLLNEDWSHIQWNRRLTFDLGAQISLVEGQLIKHLAERLDDVIVLFPEAPWVALMKQTLRAYDFFLPEPYRGDASWQPSRKQGLSFGRFSTQLAEVKDSIACVRQWLDQGIDAAQIAVVAPDIEEYWPVLSLYMKEEGIPVRKPVTSRLGGFLEISHWLSSCVRPYIKSVPTIWKCLCFQ